MPLWVRDPEKIACSVPMLTPEHSIRTTASVGAGSGKETGSIKARFGSRKTMAWALSSGGFIADVW